MTCSVSVFCFFFIERTAFIHSLKCTVTFSLVVPLLLLAVAHCYLLSLFVTRCITRCHFLSLVAPLVVTRCYSLSLFVIPCHSLYHSLPLVVSLVVTRCHSLSLDVPLVCHFINDRFKMSCLTFSLQLCLLFFLKTMKLLKDLHSIAQN